MKTTLNQNQIHERRSACDVLKGRMQISKIQPESGFTLTDLVALIAIVVVLSIMMLPALANSPNQRNAKMIQCQSHLRQIGAGCLVYANDFNDWYPIWGGYDSSHPVNKINGIWYTRYLYTGASSAPVPIGYQYGQNSGYDQNLGYLYGGGIIPNARTFFCPAYYNSPPGSTGYYLSPQYYSTPQFMTTDSGGAVHSSYMFNPRLKTATAGSYRAYQKTSDVKNKDTFCMDYLTSGANPSGLPNAGVGVPFNPDNWAHWPYKGLNVLYTDGSAKFGAITSSSMFTAIVQHLDSSGTYWPVQYNAIFDALQTSP